MLRVDTGVRHGKQQQQGHGSVGNQMAGEPVFPNQQDQGQVGQATGQVHQKVGGMQASQGQEGKNPHSDHEDFHQEAADLQVVVVNLLLAGLVVSPADPVTIDFIQIHFLFSFVKKLGSREGHKLVGQHGQSGKDQVQD